MRERCAWGGGGGGGEELRVACRREVGVLGQTPGLQSVLYAWPSVERLSELRVQRKDVCIPYLLVLSAQLLKGTSTAPKQFKPQSGIRFKL